MGTEGTWGLQTACLVPHRHSPPRSQQLWCRARPPQAPSRKPCSKDEPGLPLTLSRITRDSRQPVCTAVVRLRPSAGGDGRRRQHCQRRYTEAHDGRRRRCCQAAARHLPVPPHAGRRGEQRMALGIQRAAGRAAVHSMPPPPPTLPPAFPRSTAPASMPWRSPLTSSGCGPAPETRSSPGEAAGRRWRAWPSAAAAELRVPARVPARRTSPWLRSALPAQPSTRARRPARGLQLGCHSGARAPPAARARRPHRLGAPLRRRCHVACPPSCTPRSLHPLLRQPWRCMKHARHAFTPRAL